MPRMSMEQRLTDRVHENLMRMDFDTARFSQYIHNCGIRFQIRMFDVFVNLIRHWAIDYDNDEWTKLPNIATQQERDEYQNLLTYSKRIQESLHI